MVFDVTYFIKFLCQYYPYVIGLKKKVHGVHEEGESLGICLPFDLDYMWHMNHGKYLRNFEYARGIFAGDSGLLHNIIDSAKNKRWYVVAAVTVRYRRQVTCFERYKITTKLVYVDGRDFYFEQRMLSAGDSFVKAICLTKITMTPYGNGREILRSSGIDPAPFCGPIDRDLECFIQLNKASSEKLNPSKAPQLESAFVSEIQSMNGLKSD